MSETVSHDRTQSRNGPSKEDENVDSAYRVADPSSFGHVQPLLAKSDIDSINNRLCLLRERGNRPL